MAPCPCNGHMHAARPRLLKHNHHPCNLLIDMLRGRAWVTKQGDRSFRQCLQRRHRCVSRVVTEAIARADCDTATSYPHRRRTRQGRAEHTGAAMAALQTSRARWRLARCTGNLKLLNALSVLEKLC